MQPTTLFLLPGLMCDADVWRHQNKHLADLVHIVMPGFRGMDSLPVMAATVLQNAPKRFAVAGHSMGGRVALELWRLAPDRISKLALLETGADPLAAGEAEKRQALIDLAQSHGMQALIDFWLPPLLHPDNRGNTELWNAITAMLIRTSVGDFIKQIRALINRPDATACLKQIHCPTLLVAGRHDTLYPVRQHQQMLAEIAHARLVVLEDAGHMAPMEKPEAVTAALRQWLLL